MTNSILHAPRSTKREAVFHYECNANPESSRIDEHCELREHPVAEKLVIYT
jgi:hypothetical protein